MNSIQQSSISRIPPFLPSLRDKKVLCVSCIAIVVIGVLARYIYEYIRLNRFKDEPLRFTIHTFSSLDERRKYLSILENWKNEAAREYAANKDERDEPLFRAKYRIFYQLLLFVDNRDYAKKCPYTLLAKDQQGNLQSIAFMNKETNTLGYIGVNPRIQGRGAGSFIMRHLIDTSRADLRLEAYDTSRSFYEEKFGFTVDEGRIKEVPRYDGKTPIPDIKAPLFKGEKTYAVIALIRKINQVNDLV